MRQKASLYRPVVLILVVALVCLCGATYFLDAKLFYIMASVTGVALAAALFLYVNATNETNRFIKHISKSIGEMQVSTLQNFPLPVVVAMHGEIVWCNTAAEETFGTENWLSNPISDLIGDFSTQKNQDALICGKKYHILTSDVAKDEQTLKVYYFYDITQMSHEAAQYKLSRPSVWSIAMDSMDDVLQDAKENERSQLLSQVEFRIEEFFEARGGVVIKTHRGKFVGIIEERHMPQILEHRFELLDNIRALNTNEGIPVTLSIGVSRNAATLDEGKQAAGQALDMALGRGGDQAAVKTTAGYDFYGGLSKGIEKRTKVKTRIIATALAELIDSSFNVVIMGHKFADLDSLGAAVGLMRAVRQKGKSCVVAINRHRNLVSSLLTRLEANGYENSFLNPVDVMDKINPNTLLIIVDTHLPHVLESEEIFKACKNVVIIDHHRRMVGHIENAVIFYHEPYASSTSEMVTELVQYFGLKTPISRIESEALLAGIMLDTRNFVIRTGVRTFEAAAYLRRQGADTVDVRKMFSSTMESYQRKARIVSSAEVYRRCAIASVTSALEDIKLLAPQAADELLNISGVDVSFVLYEYDGGVTISARSMGKLNVQVVMEALGGGGHQTMAAVQMKDISMEDARQKLLEAIDDYEEKNTII